jgi:hypothetical protein
MTNDTMTKKKYILKPGKHQFAPGSPAIHTNDNLSDEEAEWYLDKYPHIAILFEDIPNSGNKDQSVQSEQQSAKSQYNEDLSTTN